MYVYRLYKWQINKMTKYKVVQLMIFKFGGFPQITFEPKTNFST